MPTDTTATAATAAPSAPLDTSAPADDREELHCDDDDDAEPGAICPCCGEGFEDDSDFRQIVTGRLSRQWMAEYVCEGCFDSYDAVYIDDWRSAWPSLECSAVAYNVATDNFYYWESDDCWHTEPEPEEESEEDPDDDSLLEYSANVLRILGWPSNVRHDELAFGVELEMEARGSRYASDLVNILGGSRGTSNGRAILKRDGSLAEHRGVELVTVPMSLATHQKSGCWREWLSADLQSAAQSGSGTTNCGIHVHINRAALSALTIGKMVVFLNNPDNATFVTTVAQRRSGTYCNRDSRKKITSAYLGGVRLRQNDGTDADYDNFLHNSRYDIINVTGGSTVEVRMFRGNLRSERVIKNIEFCHALVRFCEASSIKDSGRVGNFLQFLRQQRKQYPALFGFLQEKDYFPPPVIRGAAIPAATVSDI